MRTTTSVSAIDRVQANRYVTEMEVAVLMSLWVSVDVKQYQLNHA